MLQFLKDKLIEREIKKDLREFFNPRKEFLDKARILFLESDQKRRIVALKKSELFMSTFYSRLALSGFAVLVLFLSLTWGLAALADYENIGPKHPLYSLQRLGEEIKSQLIVDVQAKARWEKQLAHRRLKEVEELEKENSLANRKYINNAKHAFKKKISVLEEEVERGNIKEDEIREFCEVNKKITEVSNKWSSQRLASWKQFEKRCQKSGSN